MKSGLIQALGILALTVLVGCTPSSPPTTALTATPIPPTETQGSRATLTATSIPPTPIPPTPTPIFVPPPGIISAGQVWTNSIDGSEMVSVPAGEFMMGSDVETAAEGPTHMVYVDAFYIDKFEITNSQYRKCVEAGICTLLQKRTYYDDPDYDHHPVVNVMWSWANVYCDWARKRLPTEAEWEKAARGTDGRRYPWGNEIDCDHAQYKECGGQTVQVGNLPNGVSPYGAFDMAGNAWEWVIDEWQEDYYKISPSNNPQGPLNMRGPVDHYVFRGGSWSESADLLRSTYRFWYEPDAQYYNLGFRCVMDSPNLAESR